MPVPDFETSAREIIQDMLVKFSDWRDGASISWNVEKEKAIQALTQLYQQETINAELNAYANATVPGYFNWNGDKNIAKTVQERIIELEEQYTNLTHTQKGE